MKMNKKLIVGLVLTVLILSIAVVAVSAVLSGEKTSAVLSAIIGDEDYLAENDFNKDGKVDILDAILAVKYDNFKGPKATSITFDDKNYSVDFDPLGLAYTVNLPAGRPRIPLVSATAEDGATVEVVQATIADTETSGIAKILVTSSKGSNTYTVNFVRSTEKNNIVLQYDDRWAFTPDYTLADGESFKFVSSDETVLTVDEKGVITAVNVSENAVTVKAMVGDEEKDSLTVSKVDKARINLFFVTGQSNAHGCYDFDTSNANNITAAEQNAAVIQPAQMGQVYSFDVYPLANQQTGCDPELKDMVEVKYDMAEYKRGGFASMLGKTYYELSGEKVMFLQSAYNGSPIERWLDPDNAEWGSLAEKDVRNHYDATQAAHKKLMEEWFEPNKEFYEINHRANFWLQGETCMSNVWDYSANNWKKPGDGETLFTDEDYANMFLKVNAQMEKDFGIEYNNILLVRAHGSVVVNKDDNIKAAINNVRAAQYGLANNYDSIAIVSRLSDWVVPYNAKYIGTAYEPYNGLMGVKNVHYNQTGHNENGRIAATNFFKSLDADTNSNATSVEIINTDGIERLVDGTLFEIEVGNTKRLAAFALPEYSLEDVQWSSSNEKVAKVNPYGLITVVGEGDAVITATAESGVKASVNVKGVPSTKKSVHYRWDFNGNLTSSADANDLRLSDIATSNNAADKYSFTPEGRLFVDSNTDKLNRPDFTMTFPVTISSELDWTIEWKADFTSNSVFLGVDESPVVIGGNSKYPSHIYTIFSSTDLTKFPVARPLRFNDGLGREHFLTYGSTYYRYNIEDYAWKLDYTKESGTITLYIYFNDVWTYVDSIQPGEFEATYNNVCGRYDAKGTANFSGYFDYLDIKVAPAKVSEDVHYRWDFDDNYFESTYDSNQLTMSETSINANASATIETIEGGNGLVSTNSANNSRPVYAMAEPVVLTREYDWSIEWRANFAARSALLGQEASSGRNILDVAYTVSAAKYEFGLRLADDTGKSFAIPFADTKDEAVALLQNKWNTVRLTYDSDENLMTLEIKPDGATEWTTVGTYNPTTSEFVKVTYDRVFGRFDANGTINFKGTIDYLEIKTKRTVCKEAVEYDWQFKGDLTSSSEYDNTLIKNGNTVFSYGGDGEYYSTTSKTDELTLTKPITLDSDNDWSIEWRSKLIGDSTLFGTENCRADGKTRNHMYLSPSTYSGVEFHFASNYRVILKYAEDSTASKELTYNAMNTWKVEYSKADKTLTLYIENAEGGWDVCDSKVVNTFTTTFTCMFGDFGNLTGSTTGNGVNFRGDVDYIKVNCYVIDRLD